MTDKVNNISEYLEKIKEITYGDGKIRWYRGQSNANWGLKPSVWRQFSKEFERHMIHEFLFKAKSRTPLPPKDKDWPAWISLMQHFGLPTRLLDWSKSPLIALYFALDKYYSSSLEVKNDSDAAVWVLIPSKLNLISGFEPTIPSVYNETAKKMIEPAFVNPIWAEENNKIMAVSAIENELRMMVQQSAFTIHSSQTALEDYQDNETFLHKIILSKESLSAIAADLELLGLERSIVFPDLDNLSKHIRIRYEKLNR